MKEVVFFSASRIGFYLATDISRYKDAGSWPSDAVELSVADTSEFWKRSPPPGKQLGAVNGRPAWVVVQPPAPLTADQIGRLRRATYREESDHLKIEAEHDAIVAGTEPDYTAWLAKVAEIKARHPLPDQ